MNKYRLKLNKFAQKDIEKAIEYYNEKVDGLGNKFWKETKDKLETIEENPFLFQIIEDETRRAHLKTFPFGIFYIVKDFIVSVFGVIHSHRSPKVWQNRISTSDNKDVNE